MLYFSEFSAEIAERERLEETHFVRLGGRSKMMVRDFLFGVLWWTHRHDSSPRTARTDPPTIEKVPRERADGTDAAELFFVNFRKSARGWQPR